MNNRLDYSVQRTVAAPIVLEGIGLHTGVRSKLTIRPAEPGYGITFARTDRAPVIPVQAKIDSVVATQLATTLGVPERRDTWVMTVEHLMAALFALGITNAMIEVNGPEVPILDGSAEPFVAALLKRGMTLQPFSAPAIRILRPIKIHQNDSVCELLPREGLRLTVSIDFPHPQIGPQTFALEMTPDGFKQEVSRARTFGFASDLDCLRQHNLALGASLDNVLGFSPSAILNPEGTRFVDECARHKLLDALGDLALCGAGILGEFVSFRGGHAMHLALLRSLSDHRNHWEFLEAQPLKAMQPSLRSPKTSVYLS